MLMLHVGQPGTIAFKLKNKDPVYLMLGLPLSYPDFER